MAKAFEPWTRKEMRELLADNYATPKEIADAGFGFTLLQLAGMKGNMVMRARAAAKKRRYAKPDAKRSTNPLPEDPRQLLAQAG
jgi:hypothetical protein